MRRAMLAVLVYAFCAQAQVSLEHAESLWRAREYQQANAAFRDLTAAHPNNPDYKVRWGRLFLDRFNDAEAATLFQEALAIRKNHAGALLGLALVAADGFENKAVEFAEQALAADPKLTEARVLLARLALEDNDPPRAMEEADKALAIDPNALDAMAIHATIDWLDDKTSTPWIGRILSREPHYGQAYAIAGHFFVINRRYEEGIRFYRKAIELTPDLWSAHSQLGINLMRLGNEAEARAELEQSYANHYTDAATVNTLRLMDSYRNFVTVKTPHGVLRLHKKEALLLRPYFEEELERAIATYNKKYKMTLDHPVQLEVYPDHEDFAVRTMGLPGLGALGVTFGHVVAMDSPSGRPPGSFHWGTTLWHELSHVYVLTATQHRVPRWFTEGMAVYEETAVAPDWGDRLDPTTIRAIKDRKLLPVAELDRGFVRPTYPAQVVVSYFEAGRICGYIARQWGYDKLLDMMHDFAGNRSTAEVVEKELGMKPEEFDKRFLKSVDAETKRIVDGFDDWRTRMKHVAELAKAGQYQEVIDTSDAIRGVYPDYVETGSLYELRADAFAALKDKPAAIAELEGYAQAGGRSPAVLKRLATLLQEAGRPRDAATALNRLNFIYPEDEELHRRLGNLWLDEGNVSGAVQEFSAAIQCKPLDPAVSHYNLARALRAASQTGSAQNELLLALEAAPGFRPAQRMLLEITQAEQGK